MINNININVHFFLIFKCGHDGASFNKCGNDSEPIFKGKRNGISFAECKNHYVSIIECPIHFVLTVQPRNHPVSIIECVNIKIKKFNKSIFQFDIIYVLLQCK